jgi:hypothetical protein
VPDESNGRIALKVGKQRYAAKPTNHCLRQIADWCEIPSKYVNSLVGDHCDLLAQNINYWFQKEPGKRMLRTLLNGHQTARAFLSERYRPLENADLAAVILPELERLNCRVLSSEITETRLYIQAATPKVEAKAVGDLVQAGIVISNSEVGCGALAMDPMLYYLRCLNGMVLPRVMSRYHIGRKNDPMFELDSAAEFYSDATRQADDKAFWMKVRDTAKSLFDKDAFKKRVDDFEGTSKQRIKGKDAVEEITERFQLSEDESNTVLNHLIDSGSSTLFGLINAVTRTATDVESYDRSIELQRIGGQIMEMPKSVWKN